MATLGWEARLADGRVVRQGEFPYQDLFTTGVEVREFCLVDPANPFTAPLVQAKVTSEDRVIYRRRVLMTLSARTSEQGGTTRAFWQIIVQRPRYTLAGKTGDFDYFQVAFSEETGKALQRKNDFGAPFDYPELFPWEIETGVRRPPE
jgi:hypothetical protein